MNTNLGLESLKLGHVLSLFIESYCYCSVSNKFIFNYRYRFYLFLIELQEYGQS